MEEFTSGKFIYLNIDQFSTIQEVLGFDGGREVLQQTASRLAKQFPDPNSVARIGMDHFVLFLHPSEFVQYEEKLMTLTKPMHINAEEVYITYSYGAALFPEHGSTAEECLQSAQMALSYGKKVGSRGVTSLFNPYMRELSESTLHT